MFSSIFLILSLLSIGGSPRALIEALEEIVVQDLSESLYLTEAGREYVRREMEYLLDYLGQADKVTGRFVLNRLIRLRDSLFKLKIACPRREQVFSALGGEDMGNESEFLDALVLKHYAPPLPAQVRDSVDRKEKTLWREFRLKRLKFWTVGCLKGKKDKKLAQKELFKAQQ